MLVEEFGSEGTPVGLANEGAAFLERLLALAAALQPGVARILVAAKGAFDDVDDFFDCSIGTVPICHIVGDCPQSSVPDLSVRGRRR